MGNTIRLTGSQDFVRGTGDQLKATLDIVRDSGAKQSPNPKYAGSFIRYLDVAEEEP